MTQQEYFIEEHYNIIRKIISEFQMKCEVGTSTYSELQLIHFSLIFKT